MSESCRLLCCTRVHSIKDFALRKELEGGVYGSIKDFGTSFFGCQLVCWSSATSATSVAFWLVTLPFIKIFAALDLVLSLSLNSISSILNILSNFGFSNVKFRQLFSSYLLYMGGLNLAYPAPLSSAAVLCERSMLPYQTSADKALWLTYDLFAELVHQKLQEKQIELLDLKGNSLSEVQFIQIQWDARVARRTSNLCEERLIVCIDYLS